MNPGQQCRRCGLLFYKERPKIRFKGMNVCIPCAKKLRKTKYAWKQLPLFLLTIRH